MPSTSSPEPSDEDLDMLAALREQSAGVGLSSLDLLSELTREPDPDPFENLAYTDDLEHDATLEMDAVAAAWRQKIKREDARNFDATDSEYWFCVAFASRADKERFLRRAKLDVTVHGNKYLSGYVFAEMFNVDMGEGDAP